MARIIHGVVVDYRSAEEDSKYHDYDNDSDFGSASHASEDSLKGCKVLFTRTEWRLWGLDNYASGRA